MEKIETSKIEEKGLDEPMQPEERKALLKQKLFEYSKKGEHLRLQNIINDEDIDVKNMFIDKWSALQWGVVNGHAEVVKVLLEKREELRSKGVPVTEEKENVEEVKDYKKNEFDDIFKKPPNSSDSGQYTPLHWATYKGNVVVSSILIKYGFDPLEIDNVGNVTLHQAAASNNLDTFRLLMGLGLDLELKNDRGHMSIDLTANKDIRLLIEKSLSIKNCQICSKQFDFFVKRYLCAIKGEIICKGCCISDYYYEKVTSQDKDILECRCVNCYNFILETETHLRNAIGLNNLEEIFNFYHNIKQENIKISCKLADEAELNINRLEREKKIFEHLNNLMVVENHKTIEKSVHQLDEMIQNAKENKIELDINVVEKAFLQKNRLLAEKELRKVLSNLTVEQSSPENLQNLDEKINNAKMCGVEEKYLEVAVKLRENIQLNLQARELLDMFLAYPIREYPKVEPVDPKNKSKLLKDF